MTAFANGACPVVDPGNVDKAGRLQDEQADVMDVLTWLEVDPGDNAVVLIIGMDAEYAVEIEDAAIDEIHQRALDFHGRLAHIDRICLRVFISRKAGASAKVAR